MLVREQDKPSPPRRPRRPQLDQDRLRRVTRLLRILALLRSSRHKYGLAGLAEACGCSTKTIQRDLNYWREMDVVIDYDIAARTYSLIGDLPFKVLELGLVEATSLALAEASVEAAKGLDLRTTLASAFQKIHGLVPPDVGERLEGCRQALVTDGGAARDYSRAPLVPLVEACRRGLRVNVDYESRSSGRRVRPIEPYRIAFFDGFWIVIARDPGRNEVRNFALDRVHSCEFVQPDTHFRIPAGWSVTEYMAGSVGVLRGPKTDITLRFAPEAVPWLQGRQWRFPYLLSDPAEDGSVLLCGTVAGLEEITREVLRWGRHVTVLAPAALRKAVVEEAQAIVANNSDAE